MVRLRRALLFGGFIAAFVLIGMMMVRRVIEVLSPPPPNLGAKDKRLTPCPDIPSIRVEGVGTQFLNSIGIYLNPPNCVSSFAHDPAYKIAPIAYTAALDEAKATLTSILSGLRGVKIVVNLPDYVYVELRSGLLGLINDLEFVFDDEAKLIHTRAAARLRGEDDRANRQRLEKISRIFYEVSQ